MQFDIIIIGGGMVGAATARALSPTTQNQLNVALIDATPLTASDDQRLIALNYSSYSLFKKLGIWEKLAPYAATINEVHVSHRGHFGITRLSASELKLPTLGFVVPAKYINSALYENLAHITFLRPARLNNLIQDNEKVTLSVETLEGIKTISAKFIIGADGTHSTVRSLLDIPTQKLDYQQSAIVTTTELHRPHHNIAYERFQEEGAIAMLPLVGEHAATIWTGNNDTIAKLLQLSEPEFISTLQKQFGYRLGRFKTISKRFVYPLEWVQASQQVKERVILIGNAAHTVHPIAAQGLNIALNEVASLSEFINQHSLDTLSSLLIPSQNKMSMRLAHHLNWLFSNDSLMVNTARQMGMIGFDLCQPLKERFIRQVI